jgi:putative Mg2+ transporter-C (MgtC) family protein
MPFTITWHDVVIRLLLDVVAAGIIGINRDEHGRPAGFRTTLLVSLAACVAMIQMNLLAHSTGKTFDSFVVMDIMRLPLGILSGIGFIGAGAIIKRGDLVVGVTTAATLWFVTVMGLCFGGGQLGLGIAAFALGLLVLAGLKKIESQIPQERHATLSIVTAMSDDEKIESLLKSGGLKIISHSLKFSAQGADKVFIWRVGWRATRKEVGPPAVIRELIEWPGVHNLEFTA